MASAGTSTERRARPQRQSIVIGDTPIRATLQRGGAEEGGEKYPPFDGIERHSADVAFGVAFVVAVVSFTFEDTPTKVWTCHREGNVGACKGQNPALAKVREQVRSE